MSQRRSRKHHFIPEGIQKRFIEPDGIYRCRQNESGWIVEPANPSKTAYSKNLNTYNDSGELNDNLEKDFNKKSQFQNG